jgi:hypothetical protein
VRFAEANNPCLDASKKVPNSKELGTFFDSLQKDYREALMLENTFPIFGPRMVKAAITTMATKTRINAYSTRP